MYVLNTDRQKMVFLRAGKIQAHNIAPSTCISYISKSTRNGVYLINFPDPAVNTIKRPAVSDVIYKQDALWDESQTS